MSTAKVENGVKRLPSRRINAAPSRSTRSTVTTGSSSTVKPVPRSTNTTTSSTSTAKRERPTHTASSASASASNHSSSISISISRLKSKSNPNSNSNSTSTSSRSTSSNNNNNNTNTTTASSPLPLPHPPLLTLEQLLVTLKGQDKDKDQDLNGVDDQSIHSFLALLGVKSVKQLGISLLSSRHPSPSYQSGRVQSDSDSDSDPDPDLNLDSKHASISKSVINATLVGLNKVIASGWKWSQNDVHRSHSSQSQSQQPSANIRNTRIGNAKTNTNSTRSSSRADHPKPAPASSTSTSTSTSASTTCPSTPQDPAVLCLVDVFRIAIRALTIANGEAKSRDSNRDQAMQLQLQFQLQFVLVVLTFVKKLAALQMHEVVLEEISLAREVLLSLYDHENLCQEERSLCSWDQLMLYPIPTSTKGTISSNLISHILEAQTLAATSLLALQPATPGMKHDADENDGDERELSIPLGQPSAPQKWQLFLLKNLDSFNLDSGEKESLKNSSNRFCYLLERSISTLLDRISSSSSTSTSSTSSSIGLRNPGKESTSTSKACPSSSPSPRPSQLRLSLNLRLHSLKLLCLVSEIGEKRDAFWDRASRAVASFFRNSHSSSRSLASADLSSQAKKDLAAEIYRHVADFCRELVQEVQFVDGIRLKSEKMKGKEKEKEKEKETEDGKSRSVFCMMQKMSDGEGFLRFLENWHQISKKSGHGKDLDLIAALIYGTSQATSLKNDSESSLNGTGIGNGNGNGDDFSSPIKRANSSPSKSKSKTSVLSSASTSSSPVKSTRQRTALSSDESPKSEIQATKFLAHSTALLTKVIVSIDSSLSQSQGDTPIEEESRSQSESESDLDLVANLENGIRILHVDRVNLEWVATAGEESRRKWFSSLNQIRRRTLKLYDREFKRKREDEWKSESESAFKTNPTLCLSRDLLMAIVSQLEIYSKDSSLLSRSPSRPPLDSSDQIASAAVSASASVSRSNSAPSLPSRGDLIEDSIHILRTVSQSVFSLEDFQSHSESMIYLQRGYDFLISLQTGRESDLNRDRDQDGKHRESSSPSISPSIASSISSSMTKDPELEKVIPQNLAHLASSFYFLGGQLFAKKKIASSIPFLSRACEVTQLSNRMYRDLEMSSSTKEGKGEGEEEEEEEEEIKARKSRVSTLVRRLEHLACAYQNVQQYQLAFQNYLCAITTISEETFRSIELLASENGISKVFEKDTDFNRLASLLKSAVEISVFYLLLDQRFDLDSVKEEEEQEQEHEQEQQVGGGDDGKEIDTKSSPSLNLTQFLLGKGLSKTLVATLLEWSLIVLDSRMQQEEAPDAISSLLLNLTQLYEEGRHPIRRARVLLRKIEIQMYLPIELQENENEISAEKRKLQDARNLAAEALNLLKLEDLALDVGLSRFVPQYEASAHMLLVLLEQREDSDRSRQQVVLHANKASSILRALLSPLPSVPSPERSPLKVSSNLSKPDSPKTKKLPPTTPRRPAAGRGRTLKQTLKPNPTAAPQATSMPPVTPPAKTKNLISSSPVASPFNESKISAMASQYDNVERVCAQLELTFEIVNTFGHTLASIDLLKVLRRLNQTARSPSLGRDGYLRASASLTKQYLWLGKTARAGSIISKALNSISTSSASSSPQASLTGVSSDTKFRCLLANADYLCRIGCIEESVQKYQEGIGIANSIDDNVKGAAWNRLISKGLSIERQILAADTYSAIALARGDLVSTIKASYEVVRHSVKASRMISKVTASESKESKERNGDLATTAGPASDPPSDSGVIHQPSAAPVVVEHSKQAPRLATFGITTLHWRLCKSLLLGYLQISRLSAVRGSARDSNAFASECVDLATSLSVPLFQSRALVQRAEVRLMLGQLETGEADLAQGLALLDEDWIPEAIGLACLRGDSLSKINSFSEALASYSAGQTTLRSLSAAVSELEAILPTPRNNQKSSRASLGGSATPASRRTSLIAQDIILPETQGLLLRRQAWILHLLGRESEAQSFMEQASALEIDEEGKVDDSLVRGRISLRKALQQFQGHQILSMLPEAAVSLPMTSSTSSKGLASSAKGAVSALSASESAFKNALTSGKRSSHILQVREASLSLALVSTLQATIGKASKAGVLAAAGFIDGGASVTLDRELLEAIERKLKPGFVKAETFFEFEKTKPSTIIRKGKSHSDLTAFGLNSDEEAEEAEGTEDEATLCKKYWKSVKERRLGLSGHDSLSLCTSSELELPSNWTVISISLVKDQSTIMLSRQGGGNRDPVLFSLPLNRQSKREGEDEEDEFTFSKALEELNDVIGSCNTAVSAAKDLEGMDARKAWWTNRRALDSRLGELLGAMETRWFGAFKSIFSDPLTASSQEIKKLRSELDGIIAKACFPSDKEPPKPKVTDTVFETFASLSPTCSDEELEDMIHFYIDAYQFNAIPVAEDEVEMDLLVVQIRAKLEAFRGVCRREATSVDHHIFLILDKETCPFPWESMPILRNRPVSRIPSTSFLQDRIELAKIRNRSRARSESESESHKMVLDREKTFYVLNPSQDLTKSQETFSPWLESESSKSGWKGVIGRSPYMNEFSNALSSHDLLLYFGHSGAEQYIKSNQLKELPSCATTMLWGCSSGILRDQGEFDRTGTPYNYFMAGCPSLVGNLWDTTDREIDGVAMQVMRKLGLKREEDQGPEEGKEESSRGKAKGREKEKEKEKEKKSQKNNHVSGNEKMDEERRPMSIVRAVAESRNACKLPFLTGAAVICYGVPVYWE